MLKYLLIPLGLEPMLFAFRQYWLSQSENSFMIITGNYTTTDNNKTEELSTIKNQSEVFIPYKIESNSMLGGDVITTYLSSFIVESKADNIPTNLDQSILVFDSANDLLEYLKNN